MLLYYRAILYLTLNSVQIVIDIVSNYIYMGIIMFSRPSPLLPYLIFSAVFYRSLEVCGQLNDCFPNITSKRNDSQC